MVSKNNFSLNVPQQSASKTALLAGLIIIVCTTVVVTHWPVLSANAISFDDNIYLVESKLVNNPSWTSVGRILTEVLRPSAIPGFYNPLSILTILADFAMGGNTDNLMPFHRTSLILHVANTALVIVLLWLLFGRLWAAGAAGLLFGLHPMTVESVAWIADRKTLLAAFFGLWCLIFYIRFAQKNKWKLYTGSLLMYILALMSKPTTTTLPILMLLLDFWPLRRLNRRAVLEKLPLFAVGGIFAVITIISQAQTSITMPHKQGITYIILHICHNIIFYLYTIAWPVNLPAYHPLPETLSLREPIVLAGLVGSCVLIGSLILSLRWTRAVLTSWLLFFVAILPVMGIVGHTNVIASDKHAYLPSIGLLIGLTALLRWFSNTSRHGRVGVRGWLAISIVLILAGAEMTATRRCLVHWRDSLSLFKHLSLRTPNSAEVQNMLGLALESQGRLDEAISHYRQALKIRPYAKACNNIGSALAKRGDLNQAAICFNQALKIKSDYAEAHNGLGNVLLIRRDLDQAIICFNQALKIKPDYAEAHNGLGVALESQGRFDEAISHYRQALKIKPDYTNAHKNLGIALKLKAKEH